MYHKLDTLLSQTTIRYTLASIALVWLILLGMRIDTLTTLPYTQLYYVLFIANLLGTVPVLLIYVLPPQALWLRLLRIVIAVVVWRVAYFPLLVLAGYTASIGEFTSSWLYDSSVVYPVLLTCLALFNAWLSLITQWLMTYLLSVFIDTGLNQYAMNIKAIISLTLIIPLGLLATLVSFTHHTDWHINPHNGTSYKSVIKQSQTPKTNRLPQANPYFSLSQQAHGAKKILFYTAGIMYTLIPQQTHWAKQVQGALEHDVLSSSATSKAQSNTTQSTALFIHSHYRAFKAAQPFLHKNLRAINPKIIE